MLTSSSCWQVVVATYTASCLGKLFQNTDIHGQQVVLLLNPNLTNIVFPKVIYPLHSKLKINQD